MATLTLSKHNLVIVYLISFQWSHTHTATLERAELHLGEFFVIGLHPQSRPEGTVADLSNCSGAVSRLKCQVAILGNN